MPTYTAPVKDMQFLLHDVLNVSASDIPATAILTPPSPKRFWKRRARSPRTCWRR